MLSSTFKQSQAAVRAGHYKIPHLQQYSIVSGNPFWKFKSLKFIERTFGLSFLLKFTYSKGFARLLINLKQVSVDEESYCYQTALFQEQLQSANYFPPVLSDKEYPKFETVLLHDKFIASCY